MVLGNKIDEVGANRQVREGVEQRGRGRHWLGPFVRGHGGHNYSANASTFELLSGKSSPIGDGGPRLLEQGAFGMVGFR